MTQGSHYRLVTELCPVPTRIWVLWGHLACWTLNNPPKLHSDLLLLPLSLPCLSNRLSLAFSSSNVLAIANLPCTRKSSKPSHFLELENQTNLIPRTRCLTKRSVSKGLKLQCILGCYHAFGYKLLKFLTHDDLYEVIYCLLEGKGSM